MDTRKYNSNFNNHYSKKTGRINANLSHRANGKKVMEWEFETMDAEKNVVSIDINMIKEDEILLFVAYNKKYDLDIRDSDINRLYDKIDTFFQSRVDVVSVIKWEDWFEVSVTGSRSQFDDSRWSALGANLKVQIRSLKRGVHPTNGKILTISDGGYTMEFPKARSYNDDKENFIASIRTRDEAEISYIPATPENEAALNEILNKMEVLKLNLAGFLSQANVSTNLMELESKFPALMNKA